VKVEDNALLLKAIEELHAVVVKACSCRVACGGARMH